MRVVSSMSDVQFAIQQSEQQLNTALQQVSTGKRVNQLSDDPAASANMVRSLAESANVDCFTNNATGAASRLQAADSALSSVVTELNQAITAGTAGANSTMTDSNRQALAEQVQGILSSVLTQANSTYEGNYLFAGSVTGSVPFVADSGSSDGYTYEGNSEVNQIQVGATMSVETNVPGSTVFLDGANVLGSLNKLVIALQGSDTDAISQATSDVTAALNYVSAQRVPLGNAINQLDSQETYLSQETLTLSTEQTNLVGIDTAIAATNLSGAETAHNAVLAAAAKALPVFLLDYLK